MAEHQETWPVAVLCAVLEVSRSGFYTYLQRQAASPVAREQVELIARVKAIAAQTRQSYGSRRMAKQLQAEGYTVGRYRARRLMQQAGVTVHRPAQRRPQTTDSRHQHGVAPNLLARQFDVEQPDQAWVGDITYVWTAEGWLYVAESRRVGHERADRCGVSPGRLADGGGAAAASSWAPPSYGSWQSVCVSGVPRAARGAWDTL